MFPYFVRTYQREHPGVTAMWAGSGGLLWRFPDYANTDVKQISDPVDYEPLLQEHGHRAVELLAAGRFFTVAANTIALLLAFVLARRLMGFLPALIGFLLIAFDPFYAAHSHLLHLDGMLSSFMLLRKSGVP
jgi:dolichyl-phosphate-mannose--protein O-mannosyl transferase